MKPGLMKLQRASLGRERERETGRKREREERGERREEREREREIARTRMRAEVGREPGSSGFRLPKYWDYKRAPPHPTLTHISTELFLYPSWS